MLDKVAPEKPGLNLAELVREFEGATYNVPVPGAPVSTRPYQRAGAEAAARHFAEGNTLAIVDHSTASGKGHTAKVAIDIMGWAKRILYVAHRDFLLWQFQSEWDSGRPVPMEAASAGDRIHMATISKLVSLSRTNQAAFRSRLGAYDLVVADEVQHYPADEVGDDDPDAARTWAKVIAMFRARGTKVLGLTGTARRADGLPLVLPDFEDHIVHRYGTQQGVDDKYLCQVVAKTVRTHVRPRTERWCGDSLMCGFSRLHARQRNEVILKAIRDENERRGKRQQGIVFLPTVRHAEAFCEMANASRRAGRAEVVSYRMGAKEQAGVFERFLSGETSLIANVTVATEGVNLPNCDLLCMAAATRSEPRYDQQLGRGLRVCVGKDYLLVLDFVDNYRNARHAASVVNASWLTGRRGIWNACTVFKQGGVADDVELVGYSVEEIEGLLEASRRSERDGAVEPANMFLNPGRGWVSDVLSRMGDRIFITVEGERAALERFSRDYEARTGRPLARRARWAKAARDGSKSPSSVQIRAMFDQPDPSARRWIGDVVRAHRKQRTTKIPVKQTPASQNPASERGGRPFRWRFSSVEVGWALFEAGLAPGENALGLARRAEGGASLVINGAGTAMTVDIGGATIVMRAPDVVRSIGPSGLELRGATGGTILVPLGCADMDWITANMAAGEGDEGGAEAMRPPGAWGAAAPVAGAT